MSEIKTSVEKEDNSDLIANMDANMKTVENNIDQVEMFLSNDSDKDQNKDKEKSENNSTKEKEKKKKKKHDKISNTKVEEKWKKIANIPLPSEQMSFKPLSQRKLAIGERSYRSIKVPGHRMMHIQRLWKEICDPVVTQLKLQIRMNSDKNLIELRSSSKTNMAGAVQKGADFVRACILGFEIKDAIALIRLEDIYLETFDIRDVKFFNKKSDNWMRAIGRIAGQYGKIKYSIENSTNTRVVIFGFHVHILGSYASIALARNAISRLIIGSAPGNVYAKLRVVSSRLQHKF